MSHPLDSSILLLRIGFGLGVVGCCGLGAGGSGGRTKRPPFCEGMVNFARIKTDDRQNIKIFVSHSKKNNGLKAWKERSQPDGLGTKAAIKQLNSSLALG